MDGGAWWAAVHGVAKSRTRLSNFTFTFHFPALEREMATHSSVLAWRIPGTGEPGGLPSMGSHRVGHDWSDLAAAPPANTECRALMVSSSLLLCPSGCVFSLTKQVQRPFVAGSFPGKIPKNQVWNWCCILQSHRTSVLYLPKSNCFCTQLALGTYGFHVQDSISLNPWFEDIQVTMDTQGQLYYTLLYHGLEHLQILVPARDTGIKASWRPREDCVLWVWAGSRK